MALSGFPLGVSDLNFGSLVANPNGGGLGPITPNFQIPSGGGLGLNLDTAKLALSGLGTIGNLWGAFQAQNLARKQFEFSKEFSNANLNNQIKSYNTTLGDRARSRAVMEGQSDNQRDDYIRQNSLSR